MSFVLVVRKSNTFSFCCPSVCSSSSSSSSSRPRVLFFSLSSLAFSGQGCTSNYKSIEAWPGLYNLCGIFVEAPLLCESSLRERPGPSVLVCHWLFLFFFSDPSFSNEPRTILLFTRILAEKECSVCTSGPENLTRALPF